MNTQNRLTFKEKRTQTYYPSKSTCLQMETKEPLS